MGMTVQYVHQTRTGQLTYRRGIPARLRPYWPRHATEFVRTLQGRSLTETGVLQRYEQAHADYEQMFAKAERVASGQREQLHPDHIANLADAYERRMLASLNYTHFSQNDDDREWLWSPSWRAMPYGLWVDAITQARGEPLPSRRQRIIALLPDLEVSWRDALAEGDRDAIIEIEGQNADDLLEDELISSTVSDPVFFELCLELLRRDLKVLVETRRLYVEGEAPRTNSEAEPNDPPAIHNRQQQSPEPSLLTMGTVAERLANSRADPLRLTTLQARATACRYWKEVYGDMPCADIRRSHVSDWLELLLQLPVRPSPKERKMPLPELVRAFEGRKDVQRLSGKTASTHIINMATIWNGGVRIGLIGGERQNPFAGHRVRGKKPRKQSGLTLDELNAVFRLPVFTQGERPPQGRGEAAFWMPLILLTTGARPSEVAQLLVSDFEQRDDGLYMNYTDEGTHPAIGQRRLKTTEKDTGRRTFPVPDALLELGLEDYRAWLKGRGELALFPDLPAWQKGLAEAWSRWWGPYVKEAGAIPPDKRQAREFRHNFPSAARESGVSAEALSYIQGHTLAGTNASYGNLEPLGREIRKVHFAGLDLSQVKRWEPPKA